MEERTGVLVYDPNIDRMDIRFSLDSYYGGLHCGDRLEVLINGQWVKSRIEKAYSWHLVGIQTSSIVGLLVRV